MRFFEISSVIAVRYPVAPMVHRMAYEIRNQPSPHEARALLLPKYETTPISTPLPQRY